MSVRLIVRLIAGLVLALSLSETAHAASTAWVGDERAAVRLVTAADEVRDGTAVEAGIQFRFGSGWHGAWRNPGDAGFAPKFDWSGSEGIGTPEIAWPAPRRLSVSGLETFVYDEGVVLPLRLPRSGDGPVRLHVNIRHATCGEICVPYRATLDLSLPQGVALPSAEAGLIEAARMQVPGPPDAVGISVVDMRLAGGPPHPRLDVAVASRSGHFAHPDIFVEGAARAAAARPRVILSDNGRMASLSVDLPPDVDGEEPLRLTLIDGSRSAEIPFIPRTEPSPSDLVSIVAVALLGGLILNLMPCVLPVLSLKAFALTRYAGADQRAVRVGLLATSAGILTSFLVIAVAMIALKASGASVGWGIQFQEPWFLAGMAVLATLFAATLFEWVTIGLPAGLASLGSVRATGPHTEAFLTGAFATLLATPCSAPFVGTAIGFALTRGWPEILIVFVALGTGMALPFLLLASKPSLVRWLPRPGPWMNRLRSGLGLLLLVTAFWLVTVLAEVTGPLGAGVLAAALVLLLAWLRSRRHGKTVGRAVAALLAVVLLSSSFAGHLGENGRGGPWKPYKPEQIPGLVADGRIVVVDVTAAWCLTCRLNELSTLDRKEVRERLSQTDIVAMRADWTNPDARILSLLRSFGRFGIPLFAVYGPADPQGEALPELLTPGAVLSAVARASLPPSNEVAAVHERLR